MKMNARRSIIAVENFYSNPDAVREYALKQQYYFPYTRKSGGAPDNPEDDIRYWTTSWYKGHNECPFKSSAALVKRLENIVGERIDLDHWNARYPVNDRSKPLPSAPGSKNACLWHCSFHVKFDVNQKLGDGVHNHVTDVWNSVGANGWAGIIYLADQAPIEGGLNLWKNVDPAREFDWMSPAENWVHLDRFANIYNRLLLVRGNIPHSGANGWGKTVETGRMFQTFFFRTKTYENYSVDLTRSDLGL
jgi:hypothetical protein